MRLKKRTISLIIALIILGVGAFNHNMQKSPEQIPAQLGVQKTPSPISDSTPAPTNPNEQITTSSSTTMNASGLETAQVTKVVDGDTIEVNLNGKIEKVRYLEMNTPETVDPRRAVQCFGHEASDENKSLVSGKTVILTKDITDRDKYDRLLRFVYLPVGDGKLLFVNDYLVREGYAQAYPYPPDVKFIEQFRQAEKEAEVAGKGLWGKCGGNI
jgi:endonuclease YncB( thermonuclease family)